MASFIYCVKKTWESPQAKISKYVSVFCLRPNGLPALLLQVTTVLILQQVTVNKTEIHKCDHL